MICISEDRLLNIYSGLVESLGIEINYTDFKKLVAIVLNNGRENYSLINKYRECVDATGDQNLCSLIVGAMLGYLINYCMETRTCDILVEEKVYKYGVEAQKLL